MTTITYNPETHVLVPREPSEEMCDAATADSCWENMNPPPSTAYRLMIAAAPQPDPVESCDTCKNNGGTRGECQNETCGYEQRHTTPQPEPVESEPAMWLMKHIRSGDLAQAKPNQKALHPYMWSDAFPRYTTPQPDRTAELEAALKVARAALNRAADKFHDYAEIHAAKEASPENDIKVERNLMLSSEMDKALAKINEVLK